MIVDCKKPILIVEGAGDVKAVPRLIRNTLHFNGIYDINPAPRPKSNLEIRKLLRAGELERYVEYGIRDDGDSVLFILDCDDFCPITVCKIFVERIRGLRPAKKVGIALFRAEFEAIFLHCIDEISAYFADYGWVADRLQLAGDLEAIRDAKGTLSRMMKPERAYKETRDQEKFITALNFKKLHENSRSFRHFESTLHWLAGGTEAVYPMIS